MQNLKAENENIIATIYVFFAEYNNEVMAISLFPPSTYTHNPLFRSLASPYLYSITPPSLSLSQTHTHMSLTPYLSNTHTHRHTLTRSYTHTGYYTFRECCLTRRNKSSAEKKKIA